MRSSVNLDSVQRSRLHLGSRLVGFAQIVRSANAR
jgi:hypothetical protein